MTLHFSIWKETTRGWVGAMFLSSQNFLVFKVFLWDGRLTDVEVSKRTDKPIFPRSSSFHWKTKPPWSVQAFTVNIVSSPVTPPCFKAGRPYHFSKVFNCLTTASLWKAVRVMESQITAQIKWTKKERYKKNVKMSIMNSCILRKPLI